MNTNHRFFYLVSTVVVLIVLTLIFFMVRQFSIAITTVDVIEVEPGVRCARMVTMDGAAISCWVTRQNSPTDQNR